MRRWIIGAASAAGLVAALSVGPFGAAAAPPYVYGCTPAMFEGTTATSYIVSLSIYNGSSSTANLTHKVLAGTGAILNSSMFMPPPVTSSIGPTQTQVLEWGPPQGFPGPTNATVPASVRVVSNVPVSATLSHAMTMLATDWTPIVCTPQLP
jgi:hypothetical protein